MNRLPLFRSTIIFRLTEHFFVGASASTMLPSAEFICLCIAYREAFHHISNTKFCQIFSAACLIFLTLFSTSGSVIKHGLSHLMNYIIDTTIAVWYSFKGVRAKL